MNAEIRPERTTYQPGETIEGVVTWSTQKPPRRAELRLFWHTKGKGDRDSETVQQQVFDMPQQQDSRAFVLQAPDFPPSFSGRLISLMWGLELVLEPGDSQAIDLLIATGGKELDLQREEWLQIADTEKKKMFWKR